MSEIKKDPAMKNDYLWDGSGEPDPEIQELESALGRYRHNQPAPAFEQIGDVCPVKPRWSFLTVRWSYRFAAVAAVVLLAAVGFLFVRPRLAGNAGPSWDVARLEGAPRIGWHSLSEKSGPGKIGV